MFDLFKEDSLDLMLNEKNVNYIFDSRYGDDFRTIALRAMDRYSQRPGFFTPYKNIKQFVGEIIAPVLYPLAGAVLSVFAGMAVFCALGVAALTFITSLTAFAKGETSFAVEAFEFGKLTMKFAAAQCLVSLTAAILGVLSVPHSIVSLFTRTASTLMDGDCGLLPQSDEEAQVMAETSFLAATTHF